MLSPDVGVSEMLVIAAVALIVVGPKDLPLLMRRVGQFIARLRGMASEFRASFEDMARQSELDELRKEVEAMRSGSLTAPLQDGTVDQVFAEIDSGLQTGQVSLSPATTIHNPVEDVEPAATPARKPRAKKAAAPPPTPEPAPAPVKRKPAATKVAAPDIVDPPKRKRGKSEIVS